MSFHSSTSQFLNLNPACSAMRSIAPACRRAGADLHLMPHPTRILGIDPGTATIGWGVIDVLPSGLKAAAYGHIATSPEDSDEKRLHDIATDLDEVIDTYAPQEAAIEALFYFKNQKTVITVAQARGVIVEKCFAKGLTIASYTPLQVKQALTSYGRADKKQIQAMITKVLNLKAIPTPDDTADALAIALCHANTRKMLARTET